jgi:hypothetical protein
MVVRSDGNVLTILTVSIIPVTLYLVFTGIRDQAAEVLEDLGDDDDDGQNAEFVNPVMDEGGDTFELERPRV